MRGFFALALVFMFGLAVAGCGSGNSTDRAVVVNGHDVPMHLYNVAFINRRQREIDSAGYDPCSVKNAGAACTLLKQQALQTVIQQELVREYADTHHISVPQADVNRQWTLIVQQKFGGSQPALNAWLRRLHEAPTDLKDSLANDLLQQKVTYAVTPNIPSIAPAIRLAVIEAKLPALPLVQSRLSAGEDFLALTRGLAVVRAADCKALKCGELGWVPTALVPANRSELLTAKVGAVVGPYTGQLVFELYKIQARVQSYVLTAKQQYQLRLTRFAAWLSAQQNHAKVTRYVAV